MAAAILAAGVAVIMTGCSVPGSESKTESSVQESSGKSTPSETPTQAPTLTPEASSVESSADASSQSMAEESESSEESDDPDSQGDSMGSSDYESQLQILADNHDKWSTSSLDIPYGWCAVTDLDNNGRLEVISTMISGSGDYTYATICEVNETFDGVDIVPVEGVNDYHLPDFLTSSETPMYETNDGRYYVFVNSERAGEGNYYYSYEPSALIDGTLDVMVLGTECMENEVKSYRDADGNEISYDEYEDIVENTFSGFEEHTAFFCWVSPDDGELLDQLAASWAGFAVE